MTFPPYTTLHSHKETKYLNLFSQGKDNRVVVEILAYSREGKTELTGTSVAHSMRMLSTRKGPKRLQFLIVSKGSSRSSFCAHLACFLMTLQEAVNSAEHAASQHTAAAARC